MCADRQLPETMVDVKFINITPGACIDNKYQILSFIGKGGMGVVYKAQEISPSRIVAIKFLTDNVSKLVSKRFLREIKLAGQLKHKNIVHVLSAGKTENYHYMVMEYIEGVSLDVYNQKTNLSLQEKLTLIHKVALAIAYAHQNKIIHRDIKPENIIVDSNGEPKIMDFGIAKLIENQEHELTKTGEIMGTPRYMSPEQISGKAKNIDQRTDIYSLGTILYELIMGKEMICGDSVVEILYNIVHERPKFLDKNVPKILEHIWRNSTCSRLKRYKDASIFAAEIKMFLENKDLSQKQKILYSIKKHPLLFFTISLVPIFLFLLFVPKNSLSQQEIGEVNGDAQTSKVIQNLIDNEFYSEAQQEWQKIEDKRNPSMFFLQLGIWDGKEQYQKVWDENTVITNEIAALKIKAGYYLGKDLELDKEIQQLKKEIGNTVASRAYDLLQCYDLFFIYQHKKFPTLRDKYENFIECYEKIVISDNLPVKYQLELFMMAGSCYLGKIKQETISDLKKSYIEKYLDKAIYCYQKAQAINNNSFVILKGLANCLIYRQEKKEEDVETTRIYLQKCCELRPNDWESYVMLAQTYIGNRDEHHLAYANFEKACYIGKNATEPLDAILELSLKDGRYQDKVFWMLIQNVMDRQKEKVPDFLFDEIETIREQNQSRYVEYSNNKETVDIDVLMRSLSTDNYDYKVRAIKAMVMAGYRQKIMDSSADENTQKILLNISSKIKENKKGLLEYFLADLYLHKSVYSKEELIHFMPEIKGILDDKNESILLRYLAAKAIVAVLEWDILIEKMDFLDDPDLVLVCHVVLYETGFIFPLTHLENPKIKIENYHQIVLFGRIFCFDNNSFVNYSSVNNLKIHKPELGGKLEPFLHTQPNDKQEEVIRCIAAVVLGKETGTLDTWNTCSSILKKCMESANSTTRNYAHYFYWQSVMIKIAPTNQYYQYLKEYILFLSREDIAPDTKLMMLNAKHLHDSTKSIELFEAYPEVKTAFIETVVKILIKGNSDALRLKASYVLGVLVPYDETFSRITRYVELPSIYRTLIYACANIRLLSPLFQLEDNNIAKLGSKLQTFLDFAKKQWFLFEEIMSSKDSNEFKGVVYKMASLLGGKSLKHLDNANTNDDLRASIIICLTGSNVFGEYQMLVNSFRMQIKDYKDPTIREQKNFISQYLQSSSTNLQVSSWASNVYLMREEDIDKLYKEIANSNNETLKSGVSIGLHYKMRNELVEKDFFTMVGSIGYQSLYQIYIERLKEKAQDDILSKKYLKYLDYAFSLERNHVEKAQYLYEKAIIYNTLEQKENALQLIDEALHLIEPFKEQIIEVWQTYVLFKVYLLEDSENKISILSKNLKKIDKNYLLNDFIEITSQQLQIKKDASEYLQLHRQALKQQLLSLYSLNYGFSTEIFVFKHILKVHKELAEYSKNETIKAFHLQSYKIIGKVSGEK